MRTKIIVIYKKKRDVLRWHPSKIGLKLTDLGDSKEVLGEQYLVKAQKQEIKLECKDLDEIEWRDRYIARKNEQFDTIGIEKSAIKTMKKYSGVLKSLLLVCLQFTVKELNGLPWGTWEYIKSYAESGSKYL